MDALLLERLAKALHDKRRELSNDYLSPYDEIRPEAKAQCRELAQAVITSYLEAMSSSTNFYDRRDTPCQCECHCSRVEKDGNVYCDHCGKWYCDECYLKAHDKSSI